jgi:hypothetical protein
MSLGSRYWPLRLSRWPAARRQEPGYALLIPVPGDLPVFLDLALAVCREQEHEHRVQTIVVPDKPSAAIRDTVERQSASWPGRLELVELPWPERWYLPWLRNGSRNHGFQLYAGVGAAEATHIVLHDADLFLLGPGLLDRQYRSCRDGDLACVGVSPVWDRWFAEHGRTLAATWELCASVGWLRGWAPALHLGHDARMWGEDHAFDTTLHPQSLTDPARIAVLEAPDEFVHFNYVITTYRIWQRQAGAMEDNRFLLLLIRLFIDLFAADPSHYHLPTAPELSHLLGHTDGILRYPEAAEGSEAYRTFRLQLSRALAGPWGGEEQLGRAGEALAPFDRYYEVEASA